MTANLITQASVTNDPASAFGQNLAVGIGIDAYDHGIPALRSAVNDARKFGEILEAEHRFRTMLLLDEQATKAKLLTLFTETLPAQISEADRLLIYFAGHGAAIDGREGPAGCLAPQDACADQSDSMLEMSMLHAILNDLKCRHLLLILDCCFAGAFRWATMRHQRTVNVVLYQERFWRFVQDRAWQVITSAADDQYALDTFTRFTMRNDDGVHSPFALALFEALRGGADLPLSIDGGEPKGDGLITATELTFYLREWIEKPTGERRNRQTPQLWPLAKHDKGEFIFCVPGSTPILPSAPDLYVSNNPYRGLEPFEKEHATLFFGREKLTEDLKQQVITHTFTVVAGASGTGKSSLVKAGLLPKLEHIEGQQWHLLDPIRPGFNPLATLHTLKLPAATPDTLAARVEAWRAANPATCLLVVVDQLEEVITQCQEEHLRTLFLQQLADAVAQHSAFLRLVATIRTDFESQFFDSPLGGHWRAARFAVTPMTQDELRLAILGPATVRMLNFAPEALIDEMINDVIEMPGALPLLSFTLSELYLRYIARADGTRSLKEADYKALGGVAGALHKRAKDEYNKLDEAHRVTLQRIMLRMIAVEGGELTRRRVPRSELIYQDGQENERVKQVIAQFVEARLLVGNKSDRDHSLDAYIEPAHDILVRGWDELQNWLQQAQEYLTLQRRLTQAAEEWQHADESKKTGLLWNNDPRLPQVLPDLIQQPDPLDSMLDPIQVLWPSAAITRLPPWLNQVETEFIQKSVWRRANVRRWLVSTTLVVIFVLSVATIIAIIQRNNAREQEQRAVRQSQISLTGQLAAQAVSSVETELDAELGLLLAVHSFNIAKQANLTSLSEIDNALRQTLAAAPLLIARHGAPIGSIVFSPDGKRLASSASDQTTRLTDITTGKTLAVLKHKSGAGFVRFSPNGQLLITLDYVLDGLSGRVLMSDVHPLAFSPDGAFVAVQEQKSITLLATHNLQQQKRFPIQEDIATFSFSADGASMAMVGNSGVTYLWKIATGQRRRIAFDHVDQVIRAAVNSDATRLAIATKAGKVYLVDLITGKELAIFRHQDTAWQVIFSPNGTRLASWSGDGTARLIDSRNGTELAVLPHKQSVQPMTFSSEGTYLATGSMDGMGYLVQSIDGRIVTTFTHKGTIRDLVFSSDETRLVTASEDGTAKVINTNTGQLLATLHQPKLLLSVAFSPDGSRIATASENKVDGMSYDPEAHNSAYLWDANNGQLLAKFHHGDLVTAVTFSPDGAQLATAGWDNTARVWNVSSEDKTQFFKGQQSAADAVLNPNGNLIAIVVGNEVVIQDRNNHQEIARLHHDAQIYGVTFSTDGARIATVSSDHTVRLWESNTGKEIARLQHEAVTRGTPFNADSSRLATYAEDTLVHLVDAVNGKNVALLRHPEQVTTIAFSADGRVLMSGTVDGNLYFWDSIDGRQRRFVHIPGAAQISAISPNGKYVAMTANDKVATLTDRNEIRLLDWERNQVIAAIHHTSSLIYFSATFSPDSTRLATADWGGETHVTDTKTGQTLSVIHSDSAQAAIYRMQFSNDSRYLAIASADRTARLVYSQDGALFATLRHRDEVRNVAFSADGKYLTTASKDGSVWLWPIETNQLAEEGCRILTRNFSEREWETYLGRNSSYSKTCPQLPIDPAMVRTGEELAKGGDILGAIAIFERVRSLDPAQQFDPESKARQLAASAMLQKGETLARTGKVQEAVDILRQAQVISTTLKLDPVSYPNNLATAAKLSQEGTTLAKAGEIDTAIAKFKSAQTLDPQINFKPEAQARRLAAETRIAQGKTLAGQGEIQAALAAYTDTQKFDPTFTIDDSAWNQLCWEGSLWGYSNTVMFACERAIRLAPNNGNYLDSRGVARALHGDYRGAITDFQAYLEWGQWKPNQQSPAMLTQRRSWIEALMAGKNPFDLNTLIALRKQ